MMKYVDVVVYHYCYWNGELKKELGAKIDDKMIISCCLDGHLHSYMAYFTHVVKVQQYERCPLLCFQILGRPQVPIHFLIISISFMIVYMTKMITDRKGTP